MTANSTATPKLEKPPKDFPLTPNNALGYWVKKIRGKVHRFGPRWCDAKTALAEYLRDKDDLLAGREPSRDHDDLTVRDAMNYFLTDRDARLQLGELTQRSFNDYKSTCGRIIDHFGRNRAVATITPTDFTEYRKKVKGSPHTQGNEVGRVRVIFKYLYDADLIEKPVKFGPSFKKPSKSTMRKYRAEQPKKLFTPKQLHKLADAASPQLKAMILLGVNCGFGNHDCGLLTRSSLDLNTGWHDFARPKTGVERRCWLWPETVHALQGGADGSKGTELRRRRGHRLHYEVRRPVGERHEVESD